MYTQIVRGIKLDIPDRYYVVWNKFDTIGIRDKRYAHALSDFTSIERQYINRPIHEFVCIIRPYPSKIGWDIRQIVKNIKQSQR